MKVRIILLISVMSSLMAGPAWANGLVEVSALCHDGTNLNLGLNDNACLSSIGINYLTDKAAKFCAAHCSPITGKCGTNAQLVLSGSCNLVKPMYNGFTAVCHDGFKVQLKTCATPENFLILADTLCKGHIGSTGKTGYNTLSLGIRCN